MFKKLKEQLSCLECSSPSEAYRKVYIERKNKTGSTKSLKLALSAESKNNEPKTRLLDRKQQLGQALLEPQYAEPNSRGSYQIHSCTSRQSHATGLRGEDLNRNLLDLADRTLPPKRDHFRQKVNENETASKQPPHQDVSGATGNTESEQNEAESSLLSRCPEGEQQQKGREESEGCGSEAYNYGRCRSISFAGDCPDSRHRSLRKRSLSTSDSDRRLTSISGHGVENTLVSLVKHQWHSQIVLTNSQQQQAVSQPRSILKRRTKSCSLASDGSDSDISDRRTKANSVSFVDTKFNQSQVFSSSCYKKDADNAAASKIRNNNKDNANSREAVRVKGKPFNQLLFSAKPPLPQRHKINSGTTTKTLSRYQSLRTTHNKSPPLNDGRIESIQNPASVSRDSTDSGTYASSMSSDEVWNDKTAPDDASRMSGSSRSSHSDSPDFVLESIPAAVPRRMRRTRNRQKCRSSILIDKGDPGASIRRSTIDEETRKNRQADPVGDFSSSDTADSRCWRSLQNERTSAASDSLESSSDYISSTDQPDDGWLSNARIYNSALGSSAYTIAHRPTRESLTSTSGDDVDRTLCAEDFRQPFRAEYGREGDKAPSNKYRHSNRQFRSSYSTHTSVVVDEPLPSHTTRVAASVKNLRTGKKVTAFERSPAANSQSESDSFTDGADVVKPTPSMNHHPGHSRIVTKRSSSPDTTSYLDDGYSQQGSLEAATDLPVATSTSLDTAIYSGALDWELAPDDLPGSGTCTESDPNFEEMSDLLMRSTDDDLKSFLDENDLSSIFIKRDLIRTGKLIMKDENNAFCMCAGSYLVPSGTSKRKLPYCKPVTIQVYRGMNDKEDRINLLKNIMALRQLRHKYIQTVYGMALEGSPYTRDGREVIILHERTHYLVTLNKLLAWIRENNEELMTSHCAMTFALQLCEGLHYLEKRDIIHSNLSSHTVRLDRWCNIKIAGIEQFPVSTTSAPVRWMSLETLNTGNVQARSIVWTFGVLLWEILSLGARPYHNLKTGLILHKLNKGYRLPCPTRASIQIYEVLLSCWSTRPQDRPNFMSLHEAISLHQQTLPVSKPASEIFPDREDLWNIIHDHI